MNHGGGFVLPDGPESFEALGGEELQGADFPDLDVMGAIVGADEIVGGLGGRAVAVAVGQLLILLLQHLLRQLTVGNHHVQGRPQPHRYDGPVRLRPLREAPETDRLHVVQVAHHRRRTWPRREVVAEVDAEAEEDAYAYAYAQEEESGHAMMRLRLRLRVRVVVAVTVR